jgi:crotonobetainyl-CoA:carnitine CoA-transferase CaiB-like acyl-CoA transferase
MTRTAQLLPHHPATFRPLAGVRVLSLALNLPGPVALARLRALGAHVRKIEPPSGDPMRSMSAALYRAMHRGVAVQALDLKTEPGQAALHEVLRASDLLLTAFRPPALARLGLDRATLSAAHPHLSTVSIVGHPGRRANQPGHDLTYQAEAGLLDTARLPSTLLADMTGALVVMEAAMGAVMQARASGCGVHLQVALSDAAGFAALPRDVGLAGAGALLGGGLPGYAVYPCRDGLVALAALEPHFAESLAQIAGGASRAAIARWCRTHGAAQLEALAAEHDLPLRAWPLERAKPRRPGQVNT